jgi:serine/threonine-protein kinase
MSHEQLTTPLQVDVRTDIYAMGVMMYEALTGSLPFDASGYNATVMSIAAYRVDSISEQNPDVPRALEAIVLRAMAREREDRFDSAEAMIEALEAFRCGDPLAQSARPTEKRIRPRPPSRALLVGLGAVAAVLLFGLWAVGPSFEARDVPGNLPPSPRSIETSAAAAVPPRVSPVSRSANQLSGAPPADAASAAPSASAPAPRAVLQPPPPPAPPASGFPPLPPDDEVWNER